jgi:quinolinate synthase
VLAHPECEEALLDHAGFIGSTSALLRYARESSATKFIVATEPGILHQMQQSCPDKSFIPAPPEGICPCSECHYMRLNTLEKVAACMQSQSPEITMSEDLRQRALVPINRMLKMSSGDDAAGIAALADIALPFGSNSLD